MGIAGPAGTVALTDCRVPLSVRMACVTPVADQGLGESVSLDSTVKITPPVSAVLLRV